MFPHLSSRIQNVDRNKGTVGIRSESLGTQLSKSAHMAYYSACIYFQIYGNSKRAVWHCHTTLKTVCPQAINIT